MPFAVSVDIVCLDVCPDSVLGAVPVLRGAGNPTLHKRDLLGRWEQGRRIEWAGDRKREAKMLTRRFAVPRAEP